MLARGQRLRRRSDIARVYAQGRTARQGSLSLKYLSRGRDRSRVVVVVGTKVSKRAVVRNRLRRRLLAQLRELLPKLAGGYDIVISIHEDISQLAPAHSQAQLERLLHQARLL